MDQLGRLISLIEGEGLPTPTAEHTQFMRSMDGLVQGSRYELEQKLSDFEAAYTARPDAEPKEYRKSYNNFVGSQYAIFPEDDGNDFERRDVIESVHLDRYGYFKDRFRTKEVHASMDQWPSGHFLIEDGGVKSFERAKKKLDAKKKKNSDYKHCPDLSRLRFIVPSLDWLREIVCQLLHHPMHFVKIGHFNMYDDSRTKKYSTAFRARSVVFSGGDPERFEEAVATEVQVVTRHVRAVIDLDHPFNVAQKIAFPNQEDEDFVHGLMLKASILDRIDNLKELEA